jgi:hypothetical protein
MLLELRHDSVVHWAFLVQVECLRVTRNSCPIRGSRSFVASVFLRKC